MFSNSQRSRPSTVDVNRSRKKQRTNNRCDDSKLPPTRPISANNANQQRAIEDIDVSNVPLNSDNVFKTINDGYFFSYEANQEGMGRGIDVAKLPTTNGNIFKTINDSHFFSHKADQERACPNH